MRPIASLPLLVSLALVVPARAQQPPNQMPGMPGMPGMSASNDTAKPASKTPKWTYGGQADFYFGHNFNDPANQKNQLRLFDVRENHPELGLIDGWVQYARDPVGFRLETGFGPTSRYLNAFEPSHSDVWEHLEQAFVSANLERSGKTYIEVGKWYTPAGAETPVPADNWLYSRGLLYTWAMPFYHFGARVYHYFNTMDYVMVHVNRGWNAVGDPHHDPGFGVTGMKMVGKKWMLMGNYLGGQEMDMMGPMGMTAKHFRSLVDLVGTYTASAKWSFTHNLDVGVQNKATWYGLSSQAKYQFHPRQYAAARAEIFRDNAGLMTGTPQTLGSISLQYAYQVQKHLQTRLEYRHDFADNTRLFLGSGGTRFRPGQDTLTLAAIATF